MASIGYLLLRWGELEVCLGKRRMPPELDAIRELRNRL